MPKKAKELSAIEVKRLQKLGMNPVGGVSGLCLRINEGEGRSWILRTMVGIKRRDIGLGGFPSVTLAEAREKARLLKAEIAAGSDPVEARKQRRTELLAAERNGKTFKEAVEEFLASGLLAGLRNAKHQAQWGTTLRSYAVPVVGEKSLDEIAVADVKAVLDPLWHEKNETASRLRGRIERVLDWATVSGMRSGDNPARWKGNLSELLPKRRVSAAGENHPALPIDVVPNWFASLRQQPGFAAQALQFLVLTAARSGEVRGALWSEVDLDKGLWTILAKRMKAGKEHRVPLSQAALALLRQMPRFPNSIHLFPSGRGGAMSDMTLSAVMRRMQEAEVREGRSRWIDPRNGRAAVPHGLRSTFRDWVAEKTNYPRDLAEIALAHQVGTEVERAYRRSDMLEKRRQMMEDWAEFLVR
ncbi:MAG: integrase arm-type DNA-binding domain-containing protein [Proteobacteria bacterium]|nr:integrase arm-type DNA-binding domain-containing protein [Pseudomonadota bacterium]